MNTHYKYSLSMSIGVCEICWSSHVWDQQMKNLNSIISGLSRSGLLSRTFRGSLNRAVTETIIVKAISKKGAEPSQSPLQTGALSAVGGIAWKAYHVYDRNSALQKGN
jgi:uncharacterized membrane protein YebE (DUF533 family)